MITLARGVHTLLVLAFRNAESKSGANKALALRNAESTFPQTQVLALRNADSKVGRTSARFTKCRQHNLRRKCSLYEQRSGATKPNN